MSYVASGYLSLQSITKKLKERLLIQPEQFQLGLLEKI